LVVVVGRGVVVVLGVDRVVEVVDDVIRVVVVVRSGILGAL
jgi:hypothetical protein